MIKVDSQEREFCLPCADALEVEGVIVEREGSCLECTREGESHECLQLHEGFTPCLRHIDGTKCYLMFCLDCGKDIKRECE